MFYPSRFSCFSITSWKLLLTCVCVIHPSRWCVGLIILCALVETTRCMPVAGQQTDKLVHCPAVSIPSLMHPPSLLPSLLLSVPPYTSLMQVWAIMRVFRN